MTFLPEVFLFIGILILVIVGYILFQNNKIPIEGSYKEDRGNKPTSNTSAKDKEDPKTKEDSKTDADKSISKPNYRSSVLERWYQSSIQRSRNIFNMSILLILLALFVTLAILYTYFIQLAEGQKNIPNFDIIKELVRASYTILISGLAGYLLRLYNKESEKIKDSLDVLNATDLCDSLDDEKKKEKIALLIDAYIDKIKVKDSKQEQKAQN
jgi:Mn2+/Fe2+ NRAMP family transporter